MSGTSGPNGISKAGVSSQPAQPQGSPQAEPQRQQQQQQQQQQ